MTTPAELSEITTAATAAFTATTSVDDATRASWLEAIAAALDAAAERLIPIADEESRLGVPRLIGELARTTGQLRLFARVITEGSYLEATIDHASEGSTPPNIDLRRLLRPLGPVAVFGASNFPFAFSVAGGDTASALAVGCPVVAKAHPAHPRLSAAVAEIVSEALHAAGAPEGYFALVDGVDAGTALVQDPAITAVGFTGSQRGGRALFDLAVSRPDPIPFYGELSAMNPVLVTAEAVASRGQELADGLVASFTLGAGQFCTKPGLVLVPAGGGFTELVATSLGSRDPFTMLTPAIAESFTDGVRRVAEAQQVSVAAGSVDAGSSRETHAVVLVAQAADLIGAAHEVIEECFGPATLIVEYASLDEAIAVLHVVGGTLTATLHSEAGEDVATLVDVLTGIAGRVLFAGWPTGVLVSWSQQHGGPWPATTSSLHTSVGASAVRRFLRPVSYQSAPQHLLPAALQDANPLGIPRRIDGALQLA